MKILMAAFTARLKLYAEQKIDVICFIQQPCCPVFIRRENLVSKLQKMFNCYLISCCFSMYAARLKGGGGNKGKSWKNFPKYMPEAEERKQWVKRVMMGNRSEIKLKTKHHGELFFPSIPETLFSLSFYEISFHAIKNFFFFVFCNMKKTRLWTCGEPNAMILSIEEMEKVI